MSFRTYTEGIGIANDLANKAVLTESSITSLAPLSSHIFTLQKAFPQYISAAEAYSHLLASSLIPESERDGVKKKWRLVLERAEKVKRRVEEFGGQVGRAEIGDEGEEGAARRRGGVMNGVQIDMWVEPSEREWSIGKEGVFRDSRQPELADEQKALNAEWAELPRSTWDVDEEKHIRLIVQQGPGADCSVVAGLGVCIEHNRKWGTTLGQSALYPQLTGRPRRSENGRHVLKLLLNADWRSVVIDALLPRSAMTHAPLHATFRAPTSSASESVTGPPWLALAIKGYLKALGGYDIHGSNPAPDIYAFTGWIPGRLSLREGFQREKEWRRLHEGWERGHVLITLGTGEIANGLVPLHAYGVLDLRDDGDQRVLEIFDPGSRLPAQGGTGSAGEADHGSRAGTFTMRWDAVCSEFAAVYLNWNPRFKPVSATRQWSWPKPSIMPDATSDHLASSPRYRLTISQATKSLSLDMPEVWILLSQHITNKDRPLDDIALHVFGDHTRSGVTSKGAQRAEGLSPYTNGVHTLVSSAVIPLLSAQSRYQPRRAETILIVVPARDRGLYRTDFTLQALASSSTTITLERIRHSLPFKKVVTGALSQRNAGGHAGWPSWMNNPQYTLTVSPGGPKRLVVFNVILTGDKGMAWNAKLMWGRGELVTDLTQDVIVAESGAYSYGMAYLTVPSLEPGTYTLAVSSFEPSKVGAYSLSVESSHPIDISAIPTEGAGMFSRVVSGTWSEETAGGRPSNGSYHLNPRIEVILPKPSTLICRLQLRHPPPPSTPLNLTMFRRAPSAQLGDQVTTSGPYSDALSGVTTGRVTLDAGIYMLVVSAWEAGMAKGLEWEVRIWSDGAVSAGLCT